MEDLMPKIAMKRNGRFDRVLINSAMCLLERFQFSWYF
jgi:hypothetical protein